MPQLDKFPCTVQPSDRLITAILAAEHSGNQMILTGEETGDHTFLLQQHCLCNKNDSTTIAN